MFFGSEAPEVERETNLQKKKIPPKTATVLRYKRGCAL